MDALLSAQSALGYGFTSRHLKMHHGVGAREDAAPRHAAGLLGVALHDASQGGSEPFAQ